MAEAVLQLIPWIEHKLIVGRTTLTTQIQVTRRAQQCRQILRWTRSSLRISTVFDWGYTCDITEAIHKAAHQVLTNTGNPFSCAFSSPDLISNAFGIPVDKSLWLNAVEWFLSEDSEIMLSSLSGFAVHLSQLHIDKQDPVAARLMELWVRFISPRELTDVEEDIDMFFVPGPDGVDRFTKKYGDDAHLKGDPQLFHDRMQEVARTFYPRAATVANLLQASYRLYHNRYSLRRCCERGQCSPRKRVTRVRACAGVDVVLDSSGYPTRKDRRKQIEFTEEGWRELRSQWVRFISNWDAIVAKASQEFSFPWSPGVDDLVFHDMVTGYIASSAMLRRGAKFTSTQGTTIIHPGERAAVVSSQCKLLSNEGSALEKHGITRTWKDAAEEFATYARLRCDLVKRSRMAFSDSIKDWESAYTTWDSVPSSLSEWDAMLQRGEVTDDMRLVLLRQALGTKRSIQIILGRGTEGTVFGGFLPREPECGLSETTDKVLLVDRPLELGVSVYAASRSDRNSMGDSGMDVNNVEVVLDTWGSAEKTEARQGKFVKVITPSGRPHIMRLQTDNLVKLGERPTAFTELVLWVA